MGDLSPQEADRLDRAAAKAVKEALAVAGPMPDHLVQRVAERARAYREQRERERLEREAAADHDDDA